MRPLLVLAVAAGILAGSTTSAEQPVAISVRPAVATMGANAQLKVTVARDERNRSLKWEVDGPNYYRSSSVELNGASAPRCYFFLARGLPAGEFQVRATVRRNDGSASTDWALVRVVGGPES